jgi:hypothetical protein
MDISKGGEHFNCLYRPGEKQNFSTDRAREQIISTDGLRAEGHRKFSKRGILDR